MALATYGDLKTSIAAWATRSDLDDVIPDFVAWAQEEIGRRLRSNLLITRADVAITGEFADQPADFGAISTFRLDVSPRVRLKVTSAQGMEDAYDAYGTGATNPQYVAVEGAKFHFGPAFTGTPTGKLLYYATPTALVDAGDTNLVLTKYPYLYLFLSLEALFRYLEDDNNADRYGSQGGALLESINQREARDVMSGPIQVQPSPGGVV